MPVRPASWPEPGRETPLLGNTTARTLAGGALAVSALAAVLTLVQAPGAQAAALLGLPAIVAAVSWSCYLRPRVLLTDDRVTLVNVASSHTIPFSRIDEFDLRLGLTVRTDDGAKYSAWALPSSGRRVTRGRLGTVAVKHHVPAPIQDVLDAHAEWKGESDTGPDTGRTHITSRWNIWPPLLLAATVAWALWGLRTAAGL